MAPKRGLLPGGGQVQRLARYVPFGLANAVTTPDDLLPTAREWAEEIASNGPLPVRASKRAAYEGSVYALTREVAEMAPDEWTFALMENRQRHLARHATQVWRSDFA